LSYPWEQPGFGSVGRMNFVEAQVPDSISLAPQTWGWAVVGLAGVAALVLLAVWAVRRWKASAYRRLALKQWQALPQEDAQALSALLKRTALAVFPRQVVGPLYGAQLGDFLQAEGHVTTPGLSEALDVLVLRGANQMAAEQVQALHVGVGQWIRGHHV